MTCTGFAAEWCQIHGSCVCPGRANEEWELSCPLHGPESEHADDADEAAPSKGTEPALWTCPECAFTFAAEHEDEGGGHSCPCCAEAALRARLEAAEAERDELKRDRQDALAALAASDAEFGEKVAGQLSLMGRTRALAEGYSIEKLKARAAEARASQMERERDEARALIAQMNDDGDAYPKGG